MRTIFDILDDVFPVINVASVQSTLDGRVYRGDRPVDSVLRDITINALPIAGGHPEDTDLQACQIHINCFAKDVDTGVYDNTNLKAVTTAVVAVIEAFNATTKYLRLEIISQAVLESINAEGISYSSLRVECTTQFLA